MKSKRKITARLVKIKDDDRSFDVEFWQQAGAEARFAAAWQMIKEVNAIRSRDGSQPRLQRSIENVQRLGR